MKIATNELKGKLLNWAVAQVLYPAATDGEFFEFMHTPYVRRDYETGNRIPFEPTTNQCQGGHLLDQYDISVWLTFGPLDKKGKWSACMPDWFVQLDPTAEIQPEAAYGDTRLEAGMRALVRDKLGLEVDVPDELISTLPSPDEEGLEDAP